MCAFMGILTSNVLDELAVCNLQALMLRQQHIINFFAGDSL